MDASRVPEVAAESVRTVLIGSLCAVCGCRQLRGRQTMCSAACRRRRSRERQDEARRARIKDVETLLRAALTKLEEMRFHVKAPSSRLAAADGPEAGQASGALADLQRQEGGP